MRRAQVGKSPLGTTIFIIYPIREPSAHPWLRTQSVTLMDLMALATYQWLVSPTHPPDNILVRNTMHTKLESLYKGVNLPVIYTSSQATVLFIYYSHSSKMSNAFIPGQPPRIQLLGGDSQIHPVPNQQAEVVRPLPRVDPNSIEEVQNNQIDAIMQMLHKEVEVHNNTRTQLHTCFQAKLHWERWFKKSDIENQYLHRVIQDLRTKNQEEKINQFLQDEGLNAQQERCHNGLPVHNLP